MRRKGRRDVYLWENPCLFSVDPKRTEKPKWRTAIEINFSLCPASLKQPDTDLYTARPVADCTRWCLNCARPWHHSIVRHHFSWKHEACAAIIGSWRVLTSKINTYIKDVFWTPKGEGKGLHLSLFKNDYPVTIPPKLKWSFFTLKVNKWQEWDLQPGFSVSQFSSTNH